MTNLRSEPPVATSTTTETPNSAPTSIGVLGVESEDREIENSTPAILLRESMNQSSSWSIDMKGETETSKASPSEDDVNPNRTMPRFRVQPLKVPSCFPKVPVIVEESNGIGEFNGVHDIEMLMLAGCKLMRPSVNIHSADNVFVEMSGRAAGLVTDSGIEWTYNIVPWPYDRGKASVFKPPSLVLFEYCTEVTIINWFVLELGGISSSCVVIFYPGGVVDNQEFMDVESIVQAVYFERDRLLLGSGCEETHRSIVNLLISGNALQFHRGRVSLDNIQVQLVPNMNFVLGRVWGSQVVKQRLTMGGKLHIELLCTDMVEVPIGKGFVFDPGGLDPLQGSWKDDSHDRKLMCSDMSKFNHGRSTGSRPIEAITGSYMERKRLVRVDLSLMGCMSDQSRRQLKSLPTD